MTDQRPWRRALRIVGAAAVVVVMAATVRDLADDSSGPSPGSGDQGFPTPSPSAPSQSKDPSASVLASLIVTDADVRPTLTVAGLPGGNGLSQPTLDLCNGKFPSESQRTARLQVVAVDQAGETALSTEAVLYSSGAATTTAFAELKEVAASCPDEPVESQFGGEATTTRFKPTPDTDWAQVPTVERLAFAFDSIGPDGEANQSVAVYLRRGRALLGIYFSHADAPTAVVEGRTELPDIVKIFAERLSKLPVAAVSTTA
jgi:hypothetical protein